MMLRYSYICIAIQTPARSVSYRATSVTIAESAEQHGIQWELTRTAACRLQCLDLEVVLRNLIASGSRHHADKALKQPFAACES